MIEEKFKNAIEKLPLFFYRQGDLEMNANGLFQTLNDIVPFDSAYIFFLNPESIQLKYFSAAVSAIKPNDIIPFNPKFMRSLFRNEDVDQKELIKRLKLNKESDYILSRLSVRTNPFGIILLERKNTNFEAADESVMEISSAIISYLIKDIELSNVFKLQVKALKDGILETNQAYKIIKEQNTKILEADKVKNEFLANVSHELRTPLNAIIGFSEVLGAKLFGDLNEKQTEYVKDINVSGLHLLGMINEILDISKIEAKAMKLNRHSFKIAQAIDEVCNVVAPLADKKSIQIYKNIDKNIMINADYQKIQQILFNLMSNAIKFTPPNGKIEILVTSDKKRLTIKVKDTGIGIDKKYHGKIFGKFVQLESSFTKKESSTGLGLTITKELVELHGGKISLASEVNKGTTFIVEIPLLKK